MRRFKVEKKEEVFLSEIIDLETCIRKYLKHANDTGATVFHVLERIRQSLVFGVWFLYRDKKVVGFLSSREIVTDYGETINFVDYIYADAPMKWSKKLAQTGIDYAKKSGKRVLFPTKRNVDAMKRFLPGKWEVDTVILRFV